MIPRPKSARAQLDNEHYAQLRRAVLARDGWRCQFCGCRTLLEIHHLHFRSRTGDDEEQNLITLCAQCHRDLHLRRFADC